MTRFPREHGRQLLRCATVAGLSLLAAVATTLLTFLSAGAW